MLRAIRRPKASGAPSGLSNGSTVTESAPPTPAAKAATVVRSMFTHGSYLLIMGRLVTTCWRCVAGCPAPLSSSTRAHRRRAARSLAMVGNCSSVAAYRNSTSPAASSSGIPASVSTRRTRAPTAIEWPSSWASEAPRSCTVVASTTTPSVPASRARPATATRSSSAASPLTPRLVPAASSLPSAWARKARAAPTGSVEASRTTGARSSSTRSSRVARSASGATSSHSDVTPPSRSTRAASLAAFGSRPTRCARMSQSPVRLTGRPAVTRSSSAAAVPSGVTGMSSRVVRVSLSQTSSSGSSSVIRRALRSTAAVAFSQSATVQRSPGSARSSVPCSGSSSSGSSSPPSTCVMVRTLGAPAERVPHSVMFSMRPAPGGQGPSAVVRETSASVR